MVCSLVKIVSLEIECSCPIIVSPFPIIYSELNYSVITVLQSALCCLQIVVTYNSKVVTYF